MTAGLANRPTRARIYWRRRAASTNISQYQPLRENVMSNEPTARTPGARRAAPGEYVFDLGTVQKIMGGPAYSTAHGPCVEGDRMIVGLMRMKAGTGAEAHSHPNEQWIYVLEGTFHANIDGKEIDVTSGSVVYIPANTVHAGKATNDGDVVFFTVKDASHSLHGIKAT
jgi:quercetin dioxygenase-like cupin family protein